MEDDPELRAIRERLRAQMSQPQAPPPPSAPIHADDATLPRLLAEHDLLVVDCWAPWCAPCRVLEPTIEALARERAGRVAFAKVNVDENPRTSQAYSVMSLPTLLVFSRGRLVDRWVGAMPKAEVASRLDRLAARLSGSPGPRVPR